LIACETRIPWSAALLGLTKAQFTTAALKRPPLFCLKPKTLKANVEASAALLGVTRAQFIVAALKMPPLFYQKPQTLNANAARSAALLGLTKAQFTTAALKMPSLFSTKPETLNAKKPYLIKIAEELSETQDFASLIQNNPVALTYAYNRLEARYILAKLGLWQRAFSSLLKLPEAKATALILQHFAAPKRRLGR
jgi:hypothetical protein